MRDAADDPALALALVAEHERAIESIGPELADARRKVEKLERDAHDARARLADRQREAADAQSAFDDDPSTRDAYRAALEAVDVCKLEAERAERLLKSATERANAIERQCAEHRAELARVKVSPGYVATLTDPVLKHLRAARTALERAAAAWCTANRTHRANARAYEVATGSSIKKDWKERAEGKGDRVLERVPPLASVVGDLPCGDSVDVAFNSALSAACNTLRRDVIEAVSGDADGE